MWNSYASEWKSPKGWSILHRDVWQYGVEKLDAFIFHCWQHKLMTKSLTKQYKLIILCLVDQMSGTDLLRLNLGFAGCDSITKVPTSEWIWANGNSNSSRTFPHFFNCEVFFHLHIQQWQFESTHSFYLNLLLMSLSSYLCYFKNINLVELDPLTSLRITLPFTRSADCLNFIFNFISLLPHNVTHLEQVTLCKTEIVGGQNIGFHSGGEQSWQICPAGRQSFDKRIHILWFSGRFAKLYFIEWDWIS